MSPSTKKKPTEAQLKILAALEEGSPIRRWTLQKTTTRSVRESYFWAIGQKGETELKDVTVNALIDRVWVESKGITRDGTAHLVLTDLGRAVLHHG